MKLCVVFNPKGRILAASRLDVQTRVPLPRPVATGKLKALDLEVPRDFGDKDIATICQSLRVDAKRKCFVAIASKKRSDRTSSRTSV